MASKTIIEKRWVIVGKNCGLYIGQQQTRAAMIARHVSERCFDRTGNELPPFDPLNEEHRIAWKECRKRGDRCVLAVIEVKRG